MKLTLKDMEILHLKKGDIVVVKPREGYQVDPEIFYKRLDDLGKKTGIQFLAGEMLHVSVLRKPPLEIVNKEDLKT